MTSVSACLFLCRPLRQHISGNRRPIFTKFLYTFRYGRGSVLPWRRTSGFMDDVICNNGSHESISIPLQRVTSLRRRAQANAPAASYWLRRVIDDGGRRD